MVAKKKETKGNKKRSKARSGDARVKFLYSADKIILHGRRIGTAENWPKKWEGKYYFDEAAAQSIIDFFEHYVHHVEGPIAGQKFVLDQWERDMLREIFGVKRCSDGLRKYRRVYVFLPRKNGKSIIASGVALYMLLCDGEIGAQVYSAAADREQAAIVFDVAKKMVHFSEKLREMCTVYQRSIVDIETGSSYKVLSADAPNKHGKNSHAILFDELHTQKSRELWDTLTTSISARSQPLIMAMTTAGHDKESICWEVHEYALGIRNQEFVDEEFLPIMFGIPSPGENASDDEEDIEQEDEIDWTDPKVWYQVNPGLGKSKSFEYMKSECDRAQNSPSYENTFRRLELNQWTEQESRFIQMANWKKCGEKPIDLESLIGESCYLGLDLSSNRDISSCCACFPRELKRGKHIDEILEGLTIDEAEKRRETIKLDDEGYELIRNYAALWWHWAPKDLIKMLNRQGTTGAEKANSRKIRILYNKWADAGALTATPGNVIDYDRIRITVTKTIAELYDIKEIAMDPWNAQQLMTQLDGDGFTVVPFRQGYASMSAPTKELDTLILSGGLQHGNNPVTTWMARNVAVDSDAAGNIKPTKEKSSGKIDGIVALIMALGRASVNDAGSVYDERGLLVAEG
jgi:phage terminase large subunit-like protein